MERITEFITAVEVAEMLGLSRSSVYSLASAGQLPHIAITDGRQRSIIRFKRSTVERWLSERTRTGASA